MKGNKYITHPQKKNNLAMETLEGKKKALQKDVRQFAGCIKPII